MGGRLTGYSDAFMKAGEKYNINPALLAAIAAHETGNGTSNALASKNNVGGMMNPKGGGLMTFGSIEEGIDAMARNLQKNYFSQGLDTVEEIQRKYAPIGAGNDPTNLNKNWVNGVNRFYQQFYG